MEQLSRKFDLIIIISHYEFFLKLFAKCRQFRLGPNGAQNKNKEYILALFIVHEQNIIWKVFARGCLMTVMQQQRFNCESKWDNNVSSVLNIIVYGYRKDIPNDVL